MNKGILVRGRGGAGEHEVLFQDIQVPDLWDIALSMNETGQKINCFKDGEFTEVLAGDYVLDCWHLAHDLKRHAQEVLAESQTRKEDRTPEVYDINDYLLIDQQGKVQGVSGNTDFWDCEPGYESQMPPVNPSGTYTVAKVVVQQKFDSNGDLTREEVLESDEDGD
jgi:hypothetical protein